MKKLVFHILLLVSFSLISLSSRAEIICNELLKNESDLDYIFDLSDLVFIAQLSPRKGVNEQIYNYHVFDPVLKGNDIPDGFLTFADSCSPRDKEAIYVFFLASFKEKISGFNAIFFSLPDGGPGFTWIADWIEIKMKD